MSLFREVALPDDVPGQLFLHAMPGRYEPIEQAWAEVGHRGVSMIVSLTPLDEVREKSPDFARALESNTVPCSVRRLPVCDYQGPDDDDTFWAQATDTASALRRGQRVLVHCGAGIGRSGMFAIATLLALGVALDQARQYVNDAGSAPERQRQDDALHRLASRRTR